MPLLNTLPKEIPDYRTDESLVFLVSVLGTILSMEGTSTSDLQRLSQLVQTAFKTGYIAGASAVLTALEEAQKMTLDKTPSDAVN